MQEGHPPANYFAVQEWAWHEKSPIAKVGWWPYATMRLFEAHVAVSGLSEDESARVGVRDLKALLRECHTVGNDCLICSRSTAERVER